MTTTRAKITAGGSALIAGAGLALVLLTGNAGASTPTHSPATPPGTTPAVVAVTKSVDVGASTFTPAPNAPTATATITASASPAAPAKGAAGPRGKDSGVKTVKVEPGVTMPMKPGQAPTTTVFATPAAALAG